MHFEVEADAVELFEPLLNEYIEQLQQTEGESAILHYHLQEMPAKTALGALGPSENHLLNNVSLDQPKKKRGKSKNKNKLPVKDLFGDILEDAAQALEDEDLKRPARIEDEQEDDDHAELGGVYGGNSYGKAAEKSYTLTIISDPEQSGVEANFKDYQRWMHE